MRIDKRSFLKLLAAGVGTSTCPPLFAQQDVAQFNWAGNVRYGTDRLLNVTSVEQLQEFVKQQHGLKTLGSRHCFSRIADSVHHLISLHSMNRMLEIDETAKTVTVEAGIKYGELGPQLDDKGFALHNLASLPHISVAGAIATATHGSGDTNGNLASAVAEIEFVTATGELRTLSRTKDADEFLGAAVHLGALGIVTRVKLDIQPTFRASEYSYRELSMTQLYEHFAEIMDSAYSVSVFTNWDSASIRLKVHEDADFQAKAELFGARLVENDRRNAPGPWWERLPHFTMDSLAAKGNELQSEYFVSIDHAVDAIKAVASLGGRIRPLLYASELRTIAADKLWMSTCYGRPSLAIHFTWKPDKEGVTNLLPEIEARLEPFKARPHCGKLFAMDAQTIAARYERLDDFKKLAGKHDPDGKFQNAFLRERIFAKTKTARKSLRPIPDKLVVLSFDDCNKSDRLFVADILKKHGFGATFYVTEGLGFLKNKDHYTTWAEIRELHDMGFEIGNHTQHHCGVASINGEQLKKSVRHIATRCAEHGIPKPTTFCYPGFGHTLEAVRALEEVGFDFARRGVRPEYQDGGEGSRGPAYDPKVDHPLLIPSTGYDGPDWTMDDLKWAVDQASDGKIAVLCFHGVPALEHPWVNTDPEDFKKYMQYLKDAECTVIAMRDLVHYVDPSVRPKDPYSAIKARTAKQESEK